MAGEEARGGGRAIDPDRVRRAAAETRRAAESLEQKAAAVAATVDRVAGMTQAIAQREQVLAQSLAQSLRTVARTLAESAREARAKADAFRDYHVVWNVLDWCTALPREPTPAGTSEAGLVGYLLQAYGSARPPSGPGTSPRREPAPRVPADSSTVYASGREQPSEGLRDGPAGATRGWTDGEGDAVASAQRGAVAGAQRGAVAGTRVEDASGALVAGLAGVRLGVGEGHGAEGFAERALPWLRG